MITQDVLLRKKAYHSLVMRLYRLFLSSQLKQTKLSIKQCYGLRIGLNSYLQNLNA